MTKHSGLPKIVAALDLYNTVCFAKAPEPEASWLRREALFPKVVPGTATA